MRVSLACFIVFAALGIALGDMDIIPFTPENHDYLLTSPSSQIKLTGSMCVACVSHGVPMLSP